MFNQELAKVAMEFRERKIEDPLLIKSINEFPIDAFGKDIFNIKLKENFDFVDGYYTERLARIAYVASFYLEKNQKLEKVLEIGTSSGAQTAFLSKISHRLYTISANYKELIAAEQVFKRYNLHNIEGDVKKFGEGWKNLSPFDLIISNIPFNGISEELLSQLSDNGHFIFPFIKENEFFYVIIDKNKEIKKVFDIEYIFSK